MDPDTDRKKVSIQSFVRKELGVNLPEEVVRFLLTHEECLNDNPYDRSKWKSGFGDVHFICGTTSAFREQFENFPEDLVIIGYLGEDSMVIDHQVSEVGIYVAVNVKDGAVFFVDSFGKATKIDDSFASWIERFVSCLKDRDEPHEEGFLHHLSRVLKKWRSK